MFAVERADAQGWVFGFKKDFKYFSFECFQPKQMYTINL